MARTKKTIKDGYTISSWHTKDGGFKVGIPLNAFECCEPGSKASIVHRISELLLAVDIPESFCTKEQIHKVARLYD